MYTYYYGIFSESGPDPAEILTVVNVAENKYAFKTGYGRYMSVNTAGELTGRAEAIGPRETWEPVFEEVCRERERERGIIFLSCRVKWLSVPAIIGL
jgi:hypothetical protein